MLGRHLDVIFQHLTLLVLGLVAVPALAGSAGLLLGRSDVVTVRLWAERSPILAGSLYGGWSSDQSPADQGATLLTELLQTDSFTAQVLLATRPGTQLDSPEAQSFGTDLRRHVAVEVQGPHVLLISYQVSGSRDGVKLVGALVTTFERSLMATAVAQRTLTDNGLKSQVDLARRQMDEAVVAQQQYAATHNVVGSTPDPTYQSLIALARAKIETYIGLVQKADTAGLYGQAGPIQAAFQVRVLDPPHLEKSTLNWRAAKKDLGYALAGVVMAGLAFVYIAGRRDPRVLTPEETLSRLGLQPLGSVPRTRPLRVR